MVYPVVFSMIGVFYVFLFHVDIYVPLWGSVATLSATSLCFWSLYRHRRIGILVMLLWLVYVLPFVHMVPYLWFDFEVENPNILWGLIVNPYMLDERIIQLTAMIGATGGLGFAIGASLKASKSLPEFAGSFRKCAYPSGRVVPHEVTGSGSRNPITCGAAKYQLRGLPAIIWLSWVFAGVALSLLAAPENTLFSSGYAESKSILDNANFGSAWMISYVLLAFALCDAVLDARIVRARLKRAIIMVAIVYVVLVLQLFRGDRESISFVFGVLLVYFYWTAPKRQRRISWKMVWIGGSMLMVVSMVVGAVRHSLVDISNLRQLIQLLANLYSSGIISVSNLMHGTWSAVLLTPLSVAGDYYYKLLPLKLGEDYLNLVLSLPPGFIADAMAYTRPLDTLSGPAWEMRYGIGGTHATVVPFTNFLMIGVFLIIALWAYMLTSVEKWALKNISTINLALLHTLVMATPHWFWYGDKYGLNALIIWFMCAFIYKLSLGIGRLLKPI